MSAPAISERLRVPRLDELDAVFRGFADPTRIRLLNLLVVAEMCVCDLVEILDIPQPTVSRHLAYLRKAGLVTAKRDSNFAHYRLTEPANQVHRNLINCVRGCFVSIKSLDSERRRAVARAKQRESDPCK